MKILHDGLNIQYGLTIIKCTIHLYLKSSFFVSVWLYLNLPFCVCLMHRL